MKQLLALVIAAVLCITGAAPAHAARETALTAADEEFISGLKGLNDPALHRYFKDSLYDNLVSGLDNDAYFVENVETVYISQEYLDELAYNSKANIFFGYTLAELEAEFQGAKFVFTLGADGTTIVEPFQDYDDTYDKVLRNVAIGTGVILICVTVSVVTAGAGAPAISMIFAASAKTAATCALSGGAMGAISAGIFTGIQTNDMDSALKAAALAGSEGFKWGAITGAISGGASTAIKLKGATLNGLTMNEAAAIQRESKLPLSFIKNFRSVDEYNVYKAAKLIPKKINNNLAFWREIDLDLKDEHGLTNIERIKNKLSPIDETGTPYELHHIGQKTDSPLAILTKAEHIQNGNKKILHPFEALTDNPSQDPKWAQQLRAFWDDYLEQALGGV